MTDNNISKNLRVGMIIIISSNVVGSALFFSAYYITGNKWLLLAAVLVTASIFVSIFVIQKMKKKLLKYIDK